MAWIDEKWVRQLEEEYKRIYAGERFFRVIAVPCEVYSRVVGYFRPVSQWNDGKRREFLDRKMVKLESEMFTIVKDTEKEEEER